MDNTIHSDLIRGHIDTIILKALYEGDRYGFDIIKEIEQKSSGQYILKQPTLYSCLKRLEVQGFIKSYWGSKSNGGRRKYYTLTDMGKDLFIKNQSEWVYSRTVIDKLISDKDFDFSSVATNTENNTDEEKNITDDENSQYIENIDEDESDIDSEKVSEYDDETVSENDTPQDEIISDIIDGESYSDELAEQKRDENNDGYSAPEQKSQSFNRDYVDTTAIMNEMLEMQNDGSYSEKVKNEHYEPSEIIDPNSYFTESYFDDEPVAKAVPDDMDENDDFIPSFTSRIIEDYPSEQTKEPEPEFSESQNAEPQRPEFYSYDSPVPHADENAIIINREYKNILCELRDNNIVDNASRRPVEKSEPPPAPVEDNSDTVDNVEEQTETAPADSESTHELLSNENIRIRNFEKLESDVKDLGDGVKIRTHSNNAAKEYASAYYFYSNKLMLSHYLVLFILMLLEVSITFFAIRLGCPVPQKNALIFYIIAIVVSLAFPLTAFILNLISPEKKKRVTFNFRISMVFRFVVMIEALVLIYTVNIMMGMPLTFSTEYLVTLLVPAIMTTNLPVSAVIFNSLYKSGKYRIEE